MKEGKEGRNTEREETGKEREKTEKREKETLASRLSACPSVQQS